MARSAVSRSIMLSLSLCFMVAPPVTSAARLLPTSLALDWIMEFGFFPHKAWMLLLSNIWAGLAWRDWLRLKRLSTGGVNERPMQTGIALVHIDFKMRAYGGS